jgi:flagellar basal-body rod protein FlgB
MEQTHIGLFDLARDRLAWAERRQAVLAQNIANASTPGFRPRDVVPFADTLAHASVAEPRRTQPNHLIGTQAAEGQTILQQPKSRAPDGNAVSLDEQLTKVADTETAQALTTTIYQKYMALFAMALGKSA